MVGHLLVTSGRDHSGSVVVSQAVPGFSWVSLVSGMAASEDIVYIWVLAGVISLLLSWALGLVLPQHATKT